MRGASVFAVVLIIAGCGGDGSQTPGGDGPSPAEPRALVLAPSDLARGYEYGDDTGCGPASATEGDWPALEPLFRQERPSACGMELQWVWNGDPPYSHVVHSAAYAFRDGAGARRAFDAADELALFTGRLDVQARQAFELGDAAVLLRGRGLNDTASGVVWRHDNVAAVVVVEPANDDAARDLARKQQERLENPRHPPAQTESDPELQLDDPALALRVYWVGHTFDPPGALPALELGSATVGGSGPGQSIQLWYAVGGVPATVTFDTWEPDAWVRFRRTRLGRLVWDSPCARKHVVPAAGGRAEIFEGYDASTPVEPPCPTRAADRVLAHVYYPDVVVAVNMPYAYCCVSNNAGPYGTLEATETLVGALRLRSPRR